MVEDSSKNVNKRTQHDGEMCLVTLCASTSTAAKGSEPQEPAVALTIGMLAEVIFKGSCLRGQLVAGPSWGKRRVSVKLIRALVVM